MTEKRKRLIEAMQSIINSNPREQILAATLANVAEDYCEEQIKTLQAMTEERIEQLEQRIKVLEERNGIVDTGWLDVCTDLSKNNKDPLEDRWGITDYAKYVANDGGGFTKNRIYIVDDVAGNNVYVTEDDYGNHNYHLIGALEASTKEAYEKQEMMDRIAFFEERKYRTTPLTEEQIKQWEGVEYAECVAYTLPNFTKGKLYKVNSFNHLGIVIIDQDDNKFDIVASYTDDFKPVKGGGFYTR